MTRDYSNLTFYINNTKTLLKVCCLAMSFLLLSCAKSSDPSSEEIFPTASPKIFNEESIKLTSSSSTFTVEGTCDTDAYGLVYSVDEKATWDDVPGGCQDDGTYQFNVLVTQVLNLYIRSKTQFAYTSSAKAVIRLLLPPNSPLLQFQVASSSPLSSFDEPVLAFSMPWTFSGERLDLGGSYKMDTHVTGVVYAE